ncbi:MAG: hypothetical protein VX278_18045 [Myxococcota bacterium]|nr:hypothetical protein [Myxococcota bacterium]
MSCQLLFSFLTPQLDPNCFVLDGAAAIRYSQELPMDGIHRRFSLPQARFQGDSRQNGWMFQWRADVIPSAADGSYIGIAGEAMVWQLNRVQIGWNGQNFMVLAGLIDDPWVFSQNATWGNRNLGLGVAENNGMLNRADTGVAFQYQRNRFLMQFRMVSGEGELYQERNTGFNSQFFGRFNIDDNHAVDVMAQEGSRGFSSAQEHRIGARISSSGVLGYGLEVLKGWGLQGDSSLHPLVFSSWVRHQPAKGWSGLLRMDGILYEEPYRIDGLLGAGWSFSRSAQLYLHTLQSYSFDGGYQATDAQRWQQTYFLQFQVQYQRGWTP